MQKRVQSARQKLAMNINPLNYPIVLQMPRRNLSSAWMEHVPFAFYLMDLVRPSVFVELGTFYGVSYCAFCQAVAELKLNTRCHAVDTWAGDEHTGGYDVDVLANLRQHHDPLYGGFSTLIQSTFDAAVGHFEDGSIDLLHIDGYHTYEVVKHDFETWQPKLSRRGVVVFHDTNEHMEDFGVWKLWEEIKFRYPHFEFLHGHGLGIAAVGGEIPEGLAPLLNLPESEADLLRRFFYEMGQRVALSTALAEKAETERNLRSDVELRVQQLQYKDAELQAARQEIGLLKAARDQLERHIAELQKSLVIDLLTRYRNFIERALPNGSRRRRFYNLLIRGVRLLTSPAALQALFGKIKSAWQIGGTRLILRKIWYRLRGANPPIASPKQLQPIDKTSAEKLLESFTYKPLISVVMPTYNTPPRYLEIAVKSVQAQYYPHWELCICDDGSPNAETRQLLARLNDSRIKVIFAEKNGGISTATNRAAAEARGDFIALLDHDDVLTPDALFEMARLLNAQPELDAIYSDQDKINDREKRSEPFFKPDWSPDYLRAVMYVGHLLILRRELFSRVGGLNKDFDGVQDFELMLRISEQTNRIAHLPRILYHWRMLPGSVALGLDEKGEKIERLQVEAVNAHMRRIGYHAEASRHPLHRHRTVIKPQPRTHHPKVSIIILSRDAPQHIARCLASIYERTTYPDFEVVVVDNGTTDPAALAVLQQYPVQVVPFQEPFNYSRGNNLGVKAASGEIIVLLNNDTEVVTSDWLEQMVFYLDDPQIAIIGPLLIYPNKTVQHAGIVLGMRGTADHVMRGFPSDSDGYAGSLSCPRDVSAVTGACLMMRRRDYLQTGGFVEFYGTHYQDVDLCLRFLTTGSRIVYVPYAVLVHYEGATRGRFYDHLDRALLLDTWGEFIARGDPYHNPNLPLDTPDYRVR